MNYIEKKISAKECAFTFFGTLLSLIPGKIGSYLRVAFYRFTLDNCAWEIYIGFGTIFAHRDSQVGKKTSIGFYCIFGSVNIGENVMIASRVSIPSGKNQHFDKEGNLTSKTYKTQITIGNNAWI